ncbi:MAG TPA: chemotaxis protein CheW [Candidatus Kapabacteria bacterium]|nr:chemotaxis protein CheW [Candidatus Kapabacteria bacterium]
MSAIYDIDAQTNVLELVGFTIANEFFALEINCIREIIKVNDITRVPNTPSYIKGVINLRGKVIPIIDMRHKLNLPPIDYDKNTRIIILEFNNMIVGIIVDSVREVLRLDATVTEPPPVLTKGVTSDYISAIGKMDDKIINILNLTYLLNNHTVN